MTTLTKAPYLKTQRSTSMLWFKQCPKCEGDLYLDRDMYGPFVACLQCGYYLTDSQMKALLTIGEVLPTVYQEEREAALVA